MINSDTIFISDKTMRTDEVRIIKITEWLGFNIKNKTGEPLVIEPEYDKHTGKIATLTITKL